MFKKLFNYASNNDLDRVILKNLLKNDDYEAMFKSKEPEEP
jgi:hypothetical protein